MAGAAAAVTPSRFTRQFNGFLEQESRAWEARAQAVLNHETYKVAQAYARTGSEEQAIAEVADPPWLNYYDRLWLTVLPRAGELVAGLLAKVVEDIFVEAAIRWLRQNAPPAVAGVTNTTRLEIRDQIRIGVAKGETRQEIAGRITKHRRSITPGRALAIARTEVHGAANYGSLMAAGEQRVPMVKVWFAMAGARPAHAAAAGQRRALSEPFDVGGYKMDYPGQRGAPPELVINCRCSMTYEAERARRRRPAA